MLFRKNQGYLWGVIGFCLLAFGVSSWGGVKSTAGDCDMWRDFGTLLLYRLGTGRHLPVEWLDPGLQVAYPDSGQAIRAAEVIMQRAFNGYGHDAIAIKGRIPLDIHPQCILGLYLSEQFPGTRLGDWGRRQFAMCVEQAFLAAMPVADGTGSDRLEEVFLAVDKTWGDSSQVGAFAPTEVPYLCLYLIHNASLEDVRSKARERLALCLWEEYGLEPGLGQYLVLLNQGYKMDDICLDVATQLERTGAHTSAKKVYAQVLENTESVDRAGQSFERLARILLLESRQEEIMVAWGILTRRFPNGEHAASDIKEILDRFQGHREETSRRLIDELARTKGAPQLLQLCRALGGLWTLEEAPQKWKVVVDGAERGSLAETLGRVFHARAMLAAGEAEAAELAIRGLRESANPVVRAQCLAASAEIAHTRGQWRESVRLYSEALQTDRPTYLPDWCKGHLQVQPSPGDTPIAGLQKQGYFFKACHDLIDGDYAAAVDGLRLVSIDQASLPASLRRVFPCTMMLAYLGTEDYVEAEAWGYRVLEEYYEADRHDSESMDLLAKIQHMDVTVCRALAEARDQVTGGVTDSARLQNAIEIAEASAVLDLLTTSTEPVRAGVQQLYLRAKKRHIAQLLMAEYHYLRQLTTENRMARQASYFEPLLFAAQTLREVPVNCIREDFASLAGDTEATDDWLCRFSIFAQKTKRLDLAMDALDAVASTQPSSAYMEALGRLAEIYLTASNYQKAIDVYKRVAVHSTDPSKIQKVLFRVVDIYAEKLKDYGKAIEACEGLITRYPDSPLASQVEFAMGRFAYLKGDYAGAVGQLDGFLRRFPEDHRTGQAILLIGLSRMAEGNTEDAISRFTEIIRRYPDGDLAARSKFLTGYAQVSNQQYATALETFKQLIEQFPQSPYVAQAENLMDRLQKVLR